MSVDKVEEALLATLSVARALLGDVVAKSICDKFTMEIETQATVSQRLNGGALVCSSAAHGNVFVPSSMAAGLTAKEIVEGALLQIKAVRTTSGKSDLRAIEVTSENDGGWQSARTARGPRKRTSTKGRGKVDVDTEAYTRLHDAVFNRNVAVQEPAAPEPAPLPIPANVANLPESAPVPIPTNAANPPESAPVPIPANAANPPEPAPEPAPVPVQQPIGEPRAEALGNALLALLQTVANEFRQ